MNGACVLTAFLILAGEEPKAVRWTFEDAGVGRLPDGWSAAKTGDGPGSAGSLEAPGAPSSCYGVSSLKFNAPLARSSVTVTVHEPGTPVADWKVPFSARLRL